MSIYRDKRTGRWRFEFDHYVGGRRVRRRTLLPAGYTRAEAEAFDRKEGKALWSIAHGMAAPRATVDQAVACYIRERAPQMKHGNNARREIEQFRPWWSGRAIEELPAICAEYAADQHGALKPATIRNRIAYLRAACRWAWKHHGMADSDPAARVVVPVVRNAREVIVSRAEMQTGRQAPHAGPRPHIRRAHWHTILHGPRLRDGAPIPSAERRAELRWLPPIAVRMDDPDALPATIRPVS